MNDTDTARSTARRDAVRWLATPAISRDRDAAPTDDILEELFNLGYITVERAEVVDDDDNEYEIITAAELTDLGRTIHAGG